VCGTPRQRNPAATAGVSIYLLLRLISIGFVKAAMAASKIRYRCEGFHPIDAADITHAAQLFAVRIARQKYGRSGRCRRLRLQAELGSRGATFESFLGIPRGVTMTGETYRFSVFVDD
jgi:hypothetical protein